MSRSARVGLAIATPIVLALIWVWLSPYYSTILTWELRKSVFWIAALLVLAVAIGAMLFHVTVLDDNHSSATPFAAVGYVILGLALIVGAGLYVVSIHSYQQDATYAESVRVVDGQVPVFKQRPPFEVAEAQARSNLGEAPGDIAVTAYIPASQTFATLVEARGTFAGYQLVLDQNIPLTGRGQGRTCAFAPGADARLSGWFGQNLGRRIAEQQRWVNYSTGDAYAFCDPSGAPIVVVPLKTQTGFFNVTEHPAGVAVYNGATDGLTIVDDATKVPGPSYPLSLASAQRDSTQATGSYADYFFNRVGWELSDDEDALNSSASAEYVLPTVTDDEVYATPLTGRGSATSISAISTLPAGTTSDELAPITVHRLKPDWLSASAISQRIKADYQDIPNWQNLQIMELAPIDGGHWVATIGNGQNALYRVTGTGNLADPAPGDTNQATQPTCLEKVNGASLNLLRCGTVFNVGGNGPGVQPGAAAGAAASGDALSGYTNDQLIGELQRRLAQTGGTR